LFIQRLFIAHVPIVGAFSSGQGSSWAAMQPQTQHRVMHWVFWHLS